MTVLRDYQQEIVSRVHEAWMHHRSVMVQMPTGTGKTHVLAEIVRSYELQATSRKDIVRNGTHVTRSPLPVAKNILIVAHRIELIEQIKDVLHHSSLFSRHSSLIKVESVQTVARRIDSLDFTPDLIVVDEAHHALAKTYKLLWEKWPEARFLGLTATPCRLNGKGFTDLFDVLVTSWSIAEFIAKGVLSAFDYASIYPDSAEQKLIDALKMRGADGDYQVKEMNEVLNKRPSIERLYRSMMRFAKGKKGIVYAISIDHAKQIANYYKEQGVKAVAIDSQTPKEERKLLVNDFKEGKIQVLVNVDIFSEGFDCPDVEFVQMARPTLSLAKYLQQVGRGLRKTDGKENCMLIDNVGLYHVFGLPVVQWNWERMFRGLTSYRLRAAGETAAGDELQATGERFCASLRERWGDDCYMDMGLVVTHKELLDKLEEWSAPPVARDEVVLPLKVWQDRGNGKYGLRRGRERLTEAIYNKVYDIRRNDELIAVEFGDGSCGVVNPDGNVLWKRDRNGSLKFAKDDFLIVNTNGEGGKWLDLCSLRMYGRRPEIKNYRETALLKVGDNYYSRTKRCYTTRAGNQHILISDQGFHLDLTEKNGLTERGEMHFCILKGDYETYYRLRRSLNDRSIIVADMEGNCYHVARDKEKVYIGHERTEEAREACRNRMAHIMEVIETKRKSKEEEENLYLCCMYRNAVPYQSGTEWGLKVGRRITVPPIYKTVNNPVGKYCVVENHYGLWGILLIDGTMVVKPQYAKVSVCRDGKAVLVDASGKKETIKLDLTS